MIKIYTCFIMITCLVSLAFSQVVTVDEAMRTARNFYYERIHQYKTYSFEDIDIRDHYKIEKDNRLLYYVFNLEPEGYVVVSGTRNVIPVPAYSLNSLYSGSGQPPQFSAWMKQYADQIFCAIDQQLKPFPNTASLWQRLLTENPSDLKVLTVEKEVLPMLTSTWDQDLFYNQMCPADPAGPAGHCVTGCVATAMGQLCYYFRWPLSGTGSYTYEHPVYGTINANFGETEYKWNEMVNNVQKPNDAVAELLFHLGVSVDMDYGPDGSGMWNHKAAYSLRTYFKYAPSCQYLYRDSTNLDWDSTIIAHLDRKIPMYYAGWSVPNVNGHAFIVDGYQTVEYFHFNWGWSGAYDGYFYLDNLVPGGSNFNLAQELVINCYPDSVNYTFPTFCNGMDTLVNLAGTIEDGSSPVCNYENNSSCSWLISPQTIEDSVSSIKLDFNRIETEPDFDIISIYDGETTSSPLLGQFSGNDVPVTINSTGNKVLVVFQTNDTITSSGWMISYTSVIPLWCTGLTNMNSQTGSLSDGSGSFYYHNGSACMWNIVPAGATEATIFFDEFDTEENKDLVKVYDGASNQLLATYSGFYEPGYMPDPVTSPSGELFIIFSTNSTVTRQGWSAHYLSNGVSANDSPEFNQLLNLYPNPASDDLFVELNHQGSQIFEIKVFDIKGRYIITRAFLSEQAQKVRTIHVSGLDPGIYTVKIITTNSIYHRKFVKIN